MWAERTEHYLRPLLGLYWKLIDTGHTEALRSKEPALITPNHSCFLDPWLVSIVSPRPINWLTTRNWFDKSPFWRQFFLAHGCIPVEPTAAGTMRLVCEHLEKGRLIGVFPEGKISYDGKLQRFFSGVTRMAATSGAKVVPVGICGAHGLLPRNKRFPRRGKVDLKFGKPMVFPDSPCAGKLPKPAVSAFTDELYREIARLIGQDVAAVESVPEGASYRAGSA